MEIGWMPTDRRSGGLAVTVRIDFLREDFELGQRRIAELRRDRNISCIPTTRDDNTADAGDIVPGVKGIPFAVEKDLEPGAEVHRRRVFRHANVTEVTRAIASGDVHAAAQGDGKMRKVTAHADTLLMSFGGGAVAAGMVVAELNAVIDVVADRLHALPATGDRTEERPSEIGQFLGIAVSAPVKERKDVVRKIVHFPLTRIRCNLVRQPAILDQKVIAYFDAAGRCYEPGPHIAEEVNAVARRDGGRKLNPVQTQQIVLTGGMNRQQQYHRHVLMTFESDFVPGPDFQRRSPWEVAVYATDKSGQFRWFLAVCAEKTGC